MAGQLAANDIPEDVDHLLGLARGGLGGAVDLLQRVVQLGVVEGEDRLAERGGEAGVERGVPLAVLVAEADDDEVGGADQRLGADRVDARPASRARASIRSRQSEWISPER